MNIMNAWMQLMSQVWSSQSETHHISSIEMFSSTLSGLRVAEKFNFHVSFHLEVVRKTVTSNHEPSHRSEVRYFQTPEH